MGHLRFRNSLPSVQNQRRSKVAQSTPLSHWSIHRAQATTARSTTARALEQAVDGDLLLIVLTPQLMSGADPRMWKLLDSTAWRKEPGPVADKSVRVIVNRFDESGGDATDDPPGYEARAELKRAEMRDSVTARGPALKAPRTHVVAADPGAFVYTDIPDGPEDYAGGSWDGIQTLLSDLASAAENLAELRQLRAVRVRGRDLLAQAAQLKGQAPALRVAVSAAKKDRHDLQTHRSELARMRASAAADLDERLARAVGGDASASAAPDREQLVRNRVTESIAGWADGIVAAIHRFVEGSPEGLTATEAPLLSVMQMGEVASEITGTQNAPVWDALRTLHANANKVRETAKVCRDFLTSSQRLEPAANLVGVEVVELGLQALSFALDLSGRNDETQEQLRRAEAVRRAFAAAAQTAAETTAAPLWQWIDGYAAGLDTYKTALEDTLRGAQAEQSAAQRRSTEIERLLAEMPTT